MSIYEAIFNRCSVREYEMEKLAPGRLEALERYLKNIALLDEEKTVKFEIIDNSDGKQKIHGLWKVEAPYYLAVYCGNDQLSVRNAGYAAEQAVLYLTSKEFPAMALCRLFGPDLYLCEKNTPVFRKRKARL